MSRIRIRKVDRLRREDVRRLVPGYTTSETFVVHPDSTRSRLGFRLERVRRSPPFRKRYPLPRREWERYRGFVCQGASLGAFDGPRLVGLALVEVREAEHMLWLWEFGVAKSHQRQGIGTTLLRELERRARLAGFRAIGLETQTTNVPAIDFYMQNGFAVDRIDPDFYPRNLIARGEIAVFLKKRVRPRPKGQRRSTRRNQDRNRG